MRGVVVRTVRSPAQNDRRVRVPGRRHQARPPVGADPEERLRSGCRGRSIQRHLKPAVGAVFEADRHRQPRCQLPVDLALRRARADRTPGDEVGGVLGADRLEELRGARHPERGDFAQETARKAQARLDVVAAVEVRVVDQTLPPDGRARFLEVGAHDDQQVIAVLLGFANQPTGVLDAGRGVVDRAGSGDDDQPVVLPRHDRAHLIAGARHEGRPLVSDRQLGGDLARRWEGREPRDVQVGGGLGCGAGAHGSCPVWRRTPDAEPAETAKARANALACRL